MRAYRRLSVVVVTAAIIGIGGCGVGTGGGGGGESPTFSGIPSELRLEAMRPTGTATFIYTGPGTVTATRGVLEGAGAGDFRITSETCAGRRLSDRGTCTVTVNHPSPIRLSIAKLVVRTESLRAEIIVSF